MMKALLTDPYFLVDSISYFDRSSSLNKRNGLNKKLASVKSYNKLQHKMLEHLFEHDQKVDMLVSRRSFGKENAFLTLIGLSGNKSNAEYKGPKMKVVGGLFGPWSYVK